LEQNSRRIKNFVKLDGLDWEPVAKNILDWLTEEHINRLITPMNGDWHPITHRGMLPNFFEEFPDVVEMFKPLGITPCFASFFGATGPELGKIAHIDGLADCANTVGHWMYDRINIPIYNCEYSSTNFWKRNHEYDWETARVPVTRDEDKVSNGAIGPQFPSTQPLAYLECLEKIDSFTLDKPTVMRTDVFHNVEVFKFRYPRVALTVGFQEDISHLLDTNPTLQNLPDGITEAECGSYHLDTEGRVYDATAEEIQESLRDSFSLEPKWFLSLIDR